MTLGEDSSLIAEGHAPENLSLVRNLLLAALKRTPEKTEKYGNKKLSGRQKMKLCAWDNEMLLMMIQALIRPFRDALALVSPRAGISAAETAAFVR